MKFQSLVNRKVFSGQNRETVQNIFEFMTEQVQNDDVFRKSARKSCKGSWLYCEHSEKCYDARKRYCKWSHLIVLYSA